MLSPSTYSEISQYSFYMEIMTKLVNYAYKYK